MNLNATEEPTMASEGHSATTDPAGVVTVGGLLPTSPPDFECQQSWEQAKDMLEAALDIHIYFFAVVYFCIGVVSVARLYKLYTFRAGRLMSGFHFKMNMHISTLIFSLLRTVVLSLDPYGARCRISLLIVELLWSLAFPCLVVAFSLLFFLLLETTKLYPNLPCINHRTWMLVSSTILYTTILVLKDVLHNYFATPIATFFSILSLIIFVTWGLIMMLGYFYVARKIRNSLRSSGSPIESEALRRFAGLLLGCGSVGLLMITVQIFAAVSEYGLNTRTEAALANITPWGWWCLQSALRVLESAISCLLVLVASRTDNKRHVQVAPCTTWEWPRMHGWSLEAVPARPGRPMPADTKPGKHSPAIPTQSTTTKPPDAPEQEV